MPGFIDRPGRAYNVDDDTLRVRTEGFGRGEYRYYTVSDGPITTTIWTPATGTCLHVQSILVSTSGANNVTFTFNNSTLCTLVFAEKDSVPLGFPLEVCGETNESLRVVIGETGTVYITIVGQEHL